MSVSSLLDLAPVQKLTGGLPCSRYGRLKRSRAQHHINQAIVSTTSFLHLCPAGVKEVHHMLVNVAKSLVDGGENGVFSPMHLLVFKKPLENGQKAGEKASEGVHKVSAAASSAPSRK